MEIKIKVIPFALTGIAAAFLWWTRPSKASFGPFFSQWVRERTITEGENKPPTSFWAKIGNTMTNFRDKTIAEVITTAADVRHIDLLLVRLTKVYLDSHVLTFIGVCGLWTNITPPDASRY